MQARWWSAGKRADRVFDKSFNDVYDFAIRALRDPDRAADVVLETMTRIRRDLWARKIPDDVKAYAFSVAAPIVINELKDVLNVAPFAACLAEKQPIPRWSALARVPKPGEERAQRERAARAAWAELGRLPPEDYALVQLRLRHDLSIDWISLALRRKSEPVRARVRSVTQRFERSVRLRMVEDRACNRLGAKLRRLPPGVSQDERRAVIEKHAKTCDRCTSEMERTAGAVSVIKDFALIPASGCVKKEIRDRVNRAVESVGRRHPLLGGPLRVTLALLTGTSLVGGSVAAVVRLAAETTVATAPLITPKATGDPRSGSASPSASPALPAGGGRTGEIGPPGKPALTIGLEGPSTVKLRWTAPPDNGARVTSYVVERAVGNGSFTFVKSTTARSFTNTVLAGKTYRYRVAALSRAGRGASSDPRTITIPGVPPSVPLNLVATSTNCHVLLSWAPPDSQGSSKVAGYIVTRVDANGQATKLTPAPISARQYDDVWDENTGVYRYRVAAVNSTGSGPAAVSQSRTLDCIPM